MNKIECTFCHATVIGTDGAGASGWVMSFHHGAETYDLPVCPVCQRHYFTAGAAGEIELRSPVTALVARAFQAAVERGMRRAE